MECAWCGHPCVPPGIVIVPCGCSLTRCMGCTSMYIYLYKKCYACQVKATGIERSILLLSR